VSKLGFAQALISVPIGFITTILVSFAAEKVLVNAASAERGEAQELVETMHGWANVSRVRYDSAGWLFILCVLWLPILFWGLAPW